MDTIKSRLKKFKLSGIRENLEERLSYAKEASLAYEEFLELILEDEHNSRMHNSYKKKIYKSQATLR